MFSNVCPDEMLRPPLDSDSSLTSAQTQEVEAELANIIRNYENYGYRLADEQGQHRRRIPN
jgi:hypothetical protein